MQQYPYQPGQDTRYQHWRESNPHYGSYGQTYLQNVFTSNCWQAMQFESEMEFQSVFAQHMSPTLNGIQAAELQDMLNNIPRIRNYYRIQWNLELCNSLISHYRSLNIVVRESRARGRKLSLAEIMIMMLDKNRDGIMQYQEFRELLQCIYFWHQLFLEYDRDNSGFVDANEMVSVFLRCFGYNLSKAAITTLLKRYSRAMDNGQCLLAFDDFTSMCVRLRAYTEAFRARDRQMHPHGETGRYEFSYDDFIQCTMCL